MTVADSLRRISGRRGAREPFRAALERLGPGLDARIRAALVALGRASPRTTTRQYLRRAGEIERFIRSTPGCLPIAAPIDRVLCLETLLAESNPMLAELEHRCSPPTFSELAAVSLALTSALSLCQALFGIPEGDPLRPRLVAAARELGSTQRAFWALVERQARDRCRA
jgi:hypothetical protein